MRQADGLWDSCQLGVAVSDRVSLLCAPALGLIKRSGGEPASARGHGAHDIRPTCRSPRNSAWKGPEDKSIYKPTSLGQVVLPVINTCLSVWDFFFPPPNASQAF